MVHHNRQEWNLDLALPHQWRRSGVFFVNSKQISQIVLVFLFLTLHKYIPAGMTASYLVYKVWIWISRQWLEGQLTWGSHLKWEHLACEMRKRKVAAGHKSRRWVGWLTNWQNILNRRQNDITYSYRQTKKGTECLRNLTHSFSMHPFSTPWNSSGNCKIFSFFQGVEKWCIDNGWVKRSWGKIISMINKCTWSQWMPYHD